MATINKDLGMVTAYAYARSKGYTGSEEEFAQYIANVGQTAQAAAESAESAARSATTAGQSAESAAQSALEVSGAVTDAEAAATAAGESEAAAVESATDAETEALKSEGHAVGKQDGVDVDAQSEYYQNNSKYYSDRAKDIYDDAVEVRDSIPADYSTLSQDVSALKADLSNISGGYIDLLSNATYYDGYYDANASYTGTGTEGKVTGWGVVLIPVTKGDKIIISGMARGGTNSAWLNSDTLTDVYAVFSSATNDGEKTCMTNWLALSVRDPASNYTSYNVGYGFISATHDVEKEIGVYDFSAVFEFGNISISANGWSYSDSTTRVRTKNGETIHISAGVKIGLSDYSNARYYIGWKDAESYGSRGWLREDFVTTTEGDYVVLITSVPEHSEASVNNLASLFFNDSVSIYGKINEAEQDIARLDVRCDLFNIVLANSNIRSINHRGYNSIAPENTLPAYKLSKEKGFEWVETDVRWTSDGVPVLLHDETINRTARNADGTTIENDIYIKDITYEQALTYDFGIRKGEAYRGTKIPTYAEFLALCRNIGLKPYVELKSSDATTELLNGLIQTSKESGISEKITYISDSVDLLSSIGDTVKNSGLGLVTGSVNANTIASISSLKSKTERAFADSMSYTSAEIELCTAADIPLEVWTINAVGTVLALPNYVSGVTSDTLIAGYELYIANMT